MTPADIATFAVFMLATGLSVTSLSFALCLMVFTNVSARGARAGMRSRLIRSVTHALNRARAM